VLDIRDDSTEAFQDLNYLDVEAVLAYDNASDADGFRGVVVIPGEDRLYAVNDEPEGIWTLDISGLVDDAFSEFIYDTVIGWLPAPRSGERDEGVSTMSSVGPATLLPDPDGQRLYLTNFNANSLTVYDLDLGPNGTLTDEIPNLGENPYGMVLTPDGKHVVIANYGGEVAQSGLALSTLAVMDIDETSPTYLEVLTWIVDR
jgi:DNA-binding beta-propeller fold protein YncE